ncbi:MAG: glycosyltransferase family 1 protein [Verrucomicrobia bacterium]|nr:glycosyltransferase family 1 protein [Verrucomicrobiota bacterium]
MPIINSEIQNDYQLIIGVDARTAMATGRGWRRYATQFLRAASIQQQVKFRVVLPDNEYCRTFASKIDEIEWFFEEFHSRPDESGCDVVMGRETEDILAQNGGIDIYHSLTRFLARTQIRPVVVTVHDIAPLSNPPFKETLRESTRVAVRRMVDYDAAVIAVSGFTRDELLKYTPINDERIQVISPGSDSFDETSYFGINSNPEIKIPDCNSRERVVLYIGGCGENKNLTRLIESIELQNEREPTVLWMVGDPDWGYSENWNENQTTRNVPTVFLGGIPDVQVPTIFSRADILVMPSLHEGFGLPLVEAMRFGVPVCCSDIPVFREVAGGAGWYFDPADSRSMHEVFTECFGNDRERKEKIAAGLAKSATYLWEKHMKEVIDCYVEEFRRCTLRTEKGARL